MSSPAGVVRAPGFIAKTAALTAKDVRIELRRRDTLPPMLVFSLTVTLLLAFTLPTSGRVVAPRLPLVGGVPLADVLAGFVWITILFAGLIGFARTFEVERRDGALDSLLLVPVDRSALFIAKAGANLLYLAVVQLFLLPLFTLFFRIDLGARWAAWLLVVVLVDIGFAAVGTLFASLAAQTTSRELMLPVLALPALVPIFIAAVELTSVLFEGGGSGDVFDRGWFGLLIAYDVIFATLGMLAADYAMET